MVVVVVACCVTKNSSLPELPPPTPNVHGWMGCWEMKYYYLSSCSKDQRGALLVERVETTTTTPWRASILSSIAVSRPPVPGCCVRSIDNDRWEYVYLFASLVFFFRQWMVTITLATTITSLSVSLATSASMCPGKGVDTECDIDIYILPARCGWVLVEKSVRHVLTNYP